MGMHIVAGHDFTWQEQERNKPPYPAIVNQAFARRFFPGKSPVGQSFGRAGPNGVAAADNEVIGVVSDAKYRSLREPIPPTVYTAVVSGFDSQFILHVRTHQRPEAIIGPVRDALRSLDPE